MTKQGLIDELAAGNDMTKAASGRYMKDMLEAISRALHYREEVTIGGLGTFRVVTRAARTSRNPRTGEPIAVPAKTVVKFTPAKALKAAVQ